MSKWMQAKLTTLSDINPDLFFQTMDKLGYEADFSTKRIDRAEGDSYDVDCVIRNKSDKKSTKVGLKFKKNQDEKISMMVCSDWYWSSMSSEEFTEGFTIEYNTLKYQQIGAEMNFTTESVENLADGRRRIVLVRAA